MKKKIIPKIFFIVLIIVLIGLIIIVITNKQKNMTKSIYQKICEQSKFTFTIIKQDSNTKYKLKMTKFNDNINIDAEEENEKTSTLIKEGSAYYILHNKKEYYVYDSDEIEADILKSGFEDVIQKDYTKGYEKINNKEYYYEEYEGATDFFLMSTHNDFEESKIKTRFYYNKKNIEYIKTIISESEEELLKIEFSTNIDENVFNIPNDYAEL